MNSSFYVNCILVFIASALMYSCDNPKAESLDLPLAKEINVDDSGSEGNEQGGLNEKQTTQRNAGFYGVEIRKLDSDSKLYKVIVEKIQTLKGAEQHKIEVVVELEKAGFEIRTRIFDESYGWVILVKVDENWNVEIVKKSVWRT